MSALTFPPDLYRATDWSLSRSAGTADEALKQVFDEGRAHALMDLRGMYYNAVDVYQLALRTDCWIEEANLQDLVWQAGQIFVILDYFDAYLPLPRRMKRLGEKKAPVFLEYFCSRGMANTQANTEALLSALAISKLIPDAWFPEKELERQIKREIRRSGIYRKIDVELDLGLPQGGLCWLSEVTLQTVQKVRKKLAAGQPWPIRLVGRSSKLGDNRQVIVYACQEQKGRKLRLNVFEPGRAGKEHALEVVVQEQRVKVTEILGGGSHLPVLGLLYDAYIPRNPPYVCIPWLLRWEVVRKAWITVLVWMLKRGIIKFF